MFSQNALAKYLREIETAMIQIIGVLSRDYGIN